jgi:pimeloyl-ACP methyl ester carboxylesterase
LSAVELHHRDSGGDAQAVVLAHAIGCDHRMWDALAERLQPQFRVVRFDARGHGRSPVPPRPYSLDDLAGDALALIDKLGLEKVHWVGLSMGAMIGMAFALAYPERLGRLVLANTTSSYGPEGPRHVAGAGQSRRTRGARGDRAHGDGPLLLGRLPLDARRRGRHRLEALPRDARRRLTWAAATPSRSSTSAATSAASTTGRW